VKDWYRDVQIIGLTKEDAGLLSDMLLKIEKEYTKYFIPFSFDYDTIFNLLDQKIKDRYYGIKVDGKLGGFYMLRGLDKGYEVPSYGVIITKQFSGCGLARLTLCHAFSFCRVNKINKLMLKVHPENIIASRLYTEAGFVRDGIDEKNGHHIYYKDIKL